jgi:hypothetical protein
MSEKFSSVIYGMSENSSVINLLIDLQTDKAHQNFFIRFIPLVLPSISLPYN